VSDTGGSDAGAAGMALLLGGGIAEAMAAVESTLATVQNTAAQAFAGLSRMQSVGAAMAVVSPGHRVPATQAALPELPAETADQARPAERFAPPPAAAPTGPERVTEFAPVSVPGGGWMAPAPLMTPPAGGPAPMNVSFASFAPPVPAPAPSQAAGAASFSSEAARVAAPSAEAAGWLAPAAPVGGSAAPAAPMQAAPQGGPTGGDVYLDGTRVGTWLADHFAREVGRPQAGGTAFDPRLTPAWPGTLQGG
jgi:hypothetical protein